MHVVGASERLKLSGKLLAFPVQRGSLHSDIRGRAPFG